MGVYMSAPIVEKDSFDEECSGFTYGASSMQGWRMSQEDAHNCIPQFEKSAGSSLFAVYDGHGGAEVAKYCSQNFPPFLKDAIEKGGKDGNLDDLIESAFLSFDATLTGEEVVKKLKEIAGKDDDNDDEEMPDIPVGSTETDMLKAEADMPLEQLLAKYKDNPNSSNEVEEINRNGESGSGCSELPSSSSAPSSSGPTSSSKEVNGLDSQSSNNNNKEGEGKAESDLNVESEKNKTGGSGSAEVSSTSEEGSASGQRASKARAGVGIASVDFEDDSSDDDDEDEEESWEDCSDDDDDDDEEDIENDGPTMDMTNEEPGSDSGCTACVVLKQDNKLIVANAGDSRCVLSRGGKAEELSFDHKPEDDPERERIEKAGGKVTPDGRVNGGLNLSRAFGDHVYKRNKNLPLKEQMISPQPDIKTIELTDEDEFFVVACDGIWNSLSSQEVVDYVRERLADPDKRKKPSLINAELFDECLAPNILGDGTGCDNMTCIIVVFHSATFPVIEAKPKESVEVDDAGDTVGEKDSKSKDNVTSLNAAGDMDSNAIADKDEQKSCSKRAVENDSESVECDQTKKLK